MKNLTTHSWPTLLLLGFSLAAGALPSCRRSSSGGGGEARILKEVVFATRAEVDVKGVSPMGLAVSDLNLDGVADLIVGNVGSDQVQTLIGDGMGDFQSAAGQSLPAAGAPLDVVTADFNNDKYPDLVALRSLVGKASVFLGDGKGTFKSTPDVELPCGTGPTGLVAGDFDNDRNQDLVVADTAGNRLFFYRGIGTGSFFPVVEIPYVKGSQPVSLAAADFDKDGILDLAVGDLTRMVVTVRCLTKPGEQTILSKVALTGLCAADVNGDGWVDLVGVSPLEKQLHVMLNSSTGWLANPRMIKLTGPASWVRAGDLNDDGDLDLVVSYLEEMALAILHGDGTGAFSEDEVLPTTGLPWRHHVADVTGDGVLDIVASGGQSEAISLWRGSDAGIGGGRSFGHGFAEPFFVVATDLNGDGKADIVVADRGKGEVTFMEAKNGIFVVAATYKVGPYAGNLVKGDFNADGLEDIAVALDIGVRVFRKGPGTGFDYTIVPPLSQPPFQAGPGPFEVLAADMDLDGIPELITADYGGESLTILKGQKGMTFVPLQKLTITDGPIGMAQGDFDGDGNIDLALSRFKASRLVLLPGKGNGTVTAPLEVPVDAYPNYVRAADMNQDGRTDLVVSNLGGSNITILLHMAQFTFNSSKVPAGQEPSALLARDLNNDGLTDLLVATIEKGDFRVLIGDGKGGFAAIKRFPGVRGAVSADLADINGDGQDDLVLGSLYSKRVTTFLNISR